MVSRERRREISKAYCERHPDRRKASLKKYAVENCEKMKLAREKWRAGNKEREREMKLRYAVEHREEKRLSSRLYRHDNALIYRELKRRSFSKNAGCRLSNLTRKALVRSLGGLSKEIIEVVYEKNHSRNGGILVCYLCCKPILGEKGNLEHKTPISRGGTNDLANLDVAHASCNLSKGTKTYEEWLESELWRGPAEEIRSMIDDFGVKKIFEEAYK